MTAIAVKQIRIGPYSAGEIPEPFTYRFLEHDNVTPLVITGFTATFNLGTTKETATARSAAVTDGADGKVTYTWADGDIPAAGSYIAQFWVTDGSVRHGSDELVFAASAAVGPPPDV